MECLSRPVTSRALLPPSLPTSCPSLHFGWSRKHCHHGFRIGKLHRQSEQRVLVCHKPSHGVRSALSYEQYSISRAGRGCDDPVVRTLLIDNYDSYTYNLYQILSVINGVAPVVIKNDELSWEELRKLLYKDGSFDNIVISPGPGSPTCPKDIGVCLQVLQECVDIPLLGVCMGHQALGYANGAAVVHAPEPVHGRLSEIEHVNCPLFEAIPSGQDSGFQVVRYHSLMLDLASLPKELIPTAWTVDPYNRFSSGTSPFYQSNNPLSTDSVVSDDIIHLGGYGCQKKDYLHVAQPYNNGRVEIKQEEKHMSIEVVNGSSDKGARIVMAISHSTRPHYGVQFAG